MTENKEVYLITAGEYSDYYVVAVTDNKEQAEKYCEVQNKLDWDNYRVETYTMNNFEIVDENKCHYVYSFTFDEDGALIDEGYFNGEYKTDDDWEIKEQTEGVTKTFGDFDEVFYKVFVKIKDDKKSDEDEYDDRAFKIAVDEVAEFKAREAGIV